MESWLQALLEGVSDLLWGQWAALGAYVAVEPCREAVVDPEALLISTCAFGGREARMFDESLDWIITNHGLLKPWRMRRIARDFGPDVTGTLGAVLEYAAMETGRDLFPGVREEARKVLAEVAPKELFPWERGMYREGGKAPDEIFLEWKLLRGKPRVHRHSGTPDLANPANLVLRLRDYYGAGGRADVIAYLLTAGGGSSHGIAKKVKYRQGMVYQVLEGLVNAGMAQKSGGRGHAYYWIERERMAASLGLGKRLPVFFAWSDVYSALYMVYADWEEHRDAYADEFLSAERMRDLARHVVPLLRGAGEPLSRLPAVDPRRLKGSEHRHALISFLEGAMHVLRRYAPG